MNLVAPSKTERDIVEGLKYRLKVLEAIIALINLSSLLMTQFEYELSYYPHMYPCDPAVNLGLQEFTYNGMTLRLIVSIMCGMLFFLTIYTNYISYVVKREQKRIINCKHIINISWIHKKLLLQKIIY